MRIIHTSDWHLGQHFMGKSRANEHGLFLDWLLQEVQRLDIDAVIVAGDVFDTGAPPSYAREMYNGFIGKMLDVGCQLIVLGGNHDSIATLNESRQLLSRLGTHLVAGVMENPKDQIVTLFNKDGTAGAIVCGIPFIRPRDVMLSSAGQSGTEKQQAMQEAIAAHYHEIYQGAEKQRDACDSAVPIIATGHLTTVGATTSDSVRDIYIGTLDAFPANAFPPADYIALGHIHQSQRIANSDHIRYSGSPIPLSFDESGKQKDKCVLLVDFHEGKLSSVEKLMIPCFQKIQVIKGDLESIEKTLATFNSTDKDEITWLEIIVSTQDYLNDLQQRIEVLTVDLPVEVLLLRRERQQGKAALVSGERKTLNELSVNDVFEHRLEAENWETEEATKQKMILTRLHKEVYAELKDEGLA